jgi:hypothetical protein
MLERDTGKKISALWKSCSDSSGEYWPAKSDSAPPRGAGWKQDSGPGQRRDIPNTIHTVHALATYTGSFSEVCKTGALATLRRRNFALGQQLGGGKILERVHCLSRRQSTATRRVPL